MGKNRGNTNSGNSQPPGKPLVWGLLATVLTGGLGYLASQVEAVDKICQNHMVRPVCSALGIHESADKLISALGSDKEVELVAALTRLKTSVDEHPALYADIAAPFATYFNRRYQIAPADAVRKKDEANIIALSLQALSSLALAGQKQPQPATRHLVISGVDLQHAQLAGLRLPGITLSNVLLHDADLQGADLSKAVIQNSRLDRVKAGKLLAAQTRWSRTCLERAELAGADFNGAAFREIDLNGADLAGGNFSQADVDLVRFSDARLEGTRFEGARIKAISGFITPESEQPMRQASASPDALVFRKEPNAFGQCFLAEGK